MSQTTVVYNPSGTATAGMSRIGVAPAIADIEMPTVAELAAGVVFECAIEEFGVTTKVGTTSRKKLCDIKAKKRLGDAEYDDLELSIVLDDPQGEEQAMLDAMVQGSTVYLYHRPGLTHTGDIAAGQKVQVTEAIVANRDLAGITTDEGDEYQAVVTLMIQDTTDLLVDVVA